MRDVIQLFINGKPMQVRGEDCFSTLAEFLRRKMALPGTKIVCAEGDCGACSAIVGRLEGDSIKYTAVNSCIQMMYQLDCCHIVSIEGLKDEGQLNPVQQAMVSQHASQCGFCTPGFVVSLCNLACNSEQMTEETVRRGLTGNLCRCTGYDSIIQAAVNADRGSLKSPAERFGTMNIVDALKAAQKEDVLVQHGIQKFFKPASIASAVRFRKENPGCVIVTGGTDTGVQVNKRVRAVDVVLSLAGLDEMRGISFANNTLSVGATATLSELQKAAQTQLPELANFLEWFGSPLIRNAGTLAGNIGNGSPIGDSLPALFVLDAQIELTGPGGTRLINANRFYTGYRKNVMNSDEIITRILIPIPESLDVFKLFKVSRRRDLDISTFSAAVLLKMSGETITEARIALGGVAATVVRLPKTEHFLISKNATEDVFARASQIAMGEVSPISDVRGSAEYRKSLTRNIILKFWHEAFDQPAMTGGVI